MPPRVLLVHFALVSMLTLSTHAAGSAINTPHNGVPRIDPDYTLPVDQWWATHPFNARSSSYRPEIKSPSPLQAVPAGGDIQAAIDALPASGGTLKLAPGDYAKGFQIVGRSNIHVICDGQAVIHGAVRVASSKEAMEYGPYDAAVSKRGRRDPRIWELHKRPTRNFYLRNLVFDGDHQRTGLVGLQRVYDVVLDRCTFRNGVNPKKSHPGQLWGHEGLNNIWCRNCTFEGECVFACYLDGAHGSGMINCTVELAKMNSGGFLYLTNDDFTEDINENGKTDREEERTAKYIVIDGCTFNGRGHTAVQCTGDNVLVINNTALGDLRQFVGCDPRWADSDHTIHYRFYNFMVIGNRLGKVSDAVLMSRNLAAISCPPSVQPPRMGKCVIRNNTIDSTPALLKEITLPHPEFRKEGSRTAVFDGPNVIEKNTIGGKAVR